MDSPHIEALLNKIQKVNLLNNIILICFIIINLALSLSFYYSILGNEYFDFFFQRLQLAGIFITMCSICYAITIPINQKLIYVYQIRKFFLQRIENISPKQFKYETQKLSISIPKSLITHWALFENKILSQNLNQLNSVKTVHEILNKSDFIKSAKSMFIFEVVMFIVFIPANIDLFFWLFYDKTIFFELF